MEILAALIHWHCVSRSTWYTCACAQSTENYVSAIFCSLFSFDIITKQITRIESNFYRHVVVTNQYRSYQYTLMNFLVTFSICKTHTKHRSRSDMKRKNCSKACCVILHIYAIARKIYRTMSITMKIQRKEKFGLKLLYSFPSKMNPFLLYHVQVIKVIYLFHFSLFLYPPTPLPLPPPSSLLLPHIQSEERSR